MLAKKSNNHIYELEMGNSMSTTIILIDICNALEISLNQLIDLKLLNNKTEYTETFLDDFSKLTDKEKNTVICIIKYMESH